MEFWLGLPEISNFNLRLKSTTFFLCISNEQLN